MLKECQHTFCFICLSKNIRGLNVLESKCPSCTKEIKINSAPATNSQKLIDSLLIACPKCGKKFPINQYTNYHQHISTCEKLWSSNSSISNSSNSSYTINDIFNLTTQSDIPREVEDAALHVLKNKMANSHLPNKTVEFKSGGPRVSQFSFDMLYNTFFKKSVKTNKNLQTFYND